jgi:deoxyguanosine kinase
LLRQRIPEAKWIEEPVAEWQNLGGKQINMLEKYYTEPKRWGFTFQIYAIFTRIKKLQEAMERYPDKLKISERSILADKYVFSELMKDNGYMD